MSTAKVSLGVAGNPIAHSLSPDIHCGFARSLGNEVEYQRLCFPLDGFKAGASEFFAAGGSGLNVTIPFKREACDYASRLDPVAEQARARASARAGAANCTPPGPASLSGPARARCQEAEHQLGRMDAARS